MRVVISKESEPGSRTKLRESKGDQEYTWVGFPRQTANPTRPRRYFHIGMSIRRSNGDAGKCGIMLNESVGSFHEKIRYTR